ncbi:helix-turn-helix domain-containing protein [Mycobacterium sp. AMU20-3851]|uniref:PucR family transcriptional regulator n=1 Tax=Mycobacterium sp. AMU20-3851 TaxID=3122055 RepID=UPI0037553A10
MTEPLYQDVQGLLDELSEWLGRSVSLDEPDGTLITTSRHHGDEDDYRRHILLSRSTSEGVKQHLAAFDLLNSTVPVRIPALAAESFRSRVCYPVRSEKECVGLLWVFDDGLTVPDNRIIAVCRQLAVSLQRRRQVRELSRAPRKEVLERAIESDEAVTGLLDRHRQARGDLCQVAVAARRGQGETTARIAVGLAQAFTAYLNGAHSNAVVGTPIEARGVSGAVVLGPMAAGDADPAGLERFSNLVSAYAPSAGTVGLSRVGHVDDIRDAFAEAVLASVLGEALFPGVPILPAADLGALTDLIRIIDSIRVPGLQALRTLLADPAAFTTLRVFLENGGDTAMTSRELSIHRTTLYYRINRISEQTGLDLADGRNRTLAHLMVAAHLLAADPVVSANARSSYGR